MYVPQLTHSNLIPRVFTSATPRNLGGGGVRSENPEYHSQVVQALCGYLFILLYFALKIYFN